MDRPTDPPAPLALSAVSAGYERNEKDLVLDAVDLELAPGTITGLLGRNGSGKTTLMRVALGLMRARTGTARLFGEDSWDSPAEVRRRLGYVAQQFASFGWMKVDPCLAMIGSHDDWDHGLVDDLKREWQLENRRIGKLSPGDQQKVAILLAVGHKPDLLLLDEPAASLDPAARRDFLKAIVELNADRGQTVLLSSHITSDIERIASHIAILHRGRIVCHEALDEIKDRVGLVTLTEPPWPPVETFSPPREVDTGCGTPTIASWHPMYGSRRSCSKTCSWGLRLDESRPCAAIGPVAATGRFTPVRHLPFRTRRPFGPCRASTTLALRRGGDRVEPRSEMRSGDPVAGGDRAMNNAFDRWSAEIRRTLEPLRSFGIEAWVTIPIVALWFALSALDRAVAASDAVLLCVVGAVACLVGGRLGELRAWPATVLVPRYGRSLFLLGLATAARRSQRSGRGASATRFLPWGRHCWLPSLP